MLLWEALAGRHPFWNGSLLETAKRIESGAPSLAQARPDLPKPLCSLVDRMLALDPAARPSAALLARELRDAFAERQRRRKTRPTIPALNVPLRLAAPAAAALFAGWTVAALPFFPRCSRRCSRCVAGALTLVRPRLGLAFTLAVPVLPLGNISLGLALVYAAVACAWLALSWRAPRQGLFLALGPLLAPVLAPRLSPAGRAGNRQSRQAGPPGRCGGAPGGGGRRACGTYRLPFTGAAAPKGLGIAGSGDAFAVVEALVRGLQAHPALLLEAGVLAAAAVAHPLARRARPVGDRAASARA